MIATARSLPVTLLALACLSGCSTPPPPPAWVPLFDGASLQGWYPVEFGGEGEIEVVEGRIVLGFGSPLTGLRWTGAFPKNDYEIELAAARLEGSDFFCCLTFPVDDACCSLVLGGWGGALVGLSSLDDEDAARNETCRYVRFDTGRPYRIRLRVAGRRIDAWLDGEPLLQVDATGRALSTRIEVAGTEPLGICAFATVAALWDLRYRATPADG